MFSFALKNLLSRPLRTALALCGLTVAIAGMVGLFSVAEGIQDTVRTTFGKMPGVTLLQPGAPLPLFSRLPTAWGEEIAKLPGVHVVHSEVWSRAHLVEGKPAISPPRFLFGSDLVQADQLRYSVYREKMVQGRSLNSNDRGTQRCVISQAIADEYGRVLGENLRVDGHDLEIVGIYKCDSLFLDVSIILDIALVRKLGHLGEDTVCNFYVEPDLDTSSEVLTTRLKDLFAGRSPGAWQPTIEQAIDLAGDSPMVKQLAPLARMAAAAAGGNEEVSPVADEIPVEVRGNEDWSQQVHQLSADLDLFLAIMTSIGVTIAFMGIVNTMLMSVSERIIEFGILKANGWSGAEVLRLIGFESAILGFGGGVLGSIVGWIATHAINAQFPTRIHLYASPKLLVVSLLFSCVLGILAGLYPALRAARMAPMEAIRRG
ncbi:MAG: ABC transporter permease [Planctomycetota bacterium]|nr:ABC transporter permease [Planctomycetota bacterium]